MATCLCGCCCGGGEGGVWMSSSEIWSHLHRRRLQGGFEEHVGRLWGWHKWKVWWSTHGLANLGRDLPTERFGNPYANLSRENCGGHNGEDFVNQLPHGRGWYYGDFITLGMRWKTPPLVIQSLITHIDFPTYYGSGEPKEWIYGAKHFFYYHKTREEEKVELTSFHLHKCDDPPNFTIRTPLLVRQLEAH